MTEIIVVRYNLKNIEDNCLRSIIDNTSDYNLTVCDNFKDNENLGKLWNRLIEKSDSKYICLLNSDTVVTPYWLEGLLDVFRSNPKIGCVGPSTNHSRNQQSKPESVNQVFVDFGSAFPGWCLSGFCLVFPKSVWKEVGGFPEDLGFYGQEVIFIDKLTKAGYHQIWRTDIFVYHYGSMSAKASGMDIDKERSKANKIISKLRSKNAD